MWIVDPTQSRPELRLPGPGPNQGVDLSGRVCLLSNSKPNAGQLEVHPGWVRSGVDNKKGHKAYYINLEAKPGMGDKVEQFMRDILAGVEQEPGTGPWFGCRFSDTTFGIFEAFPDSAARDAHDIGPGGRNFLRSELLDEMLAYPSHIYRLDVMFGKFTTMFGKKITS